MSPIALLSTAYLPPVHYFTKLFTYPQVMIEQMDHYVKQTYRNRCVIAAPDGPLALTIPTVKPDTEKCPLRDIRISDHGNWRHLHWHALLSAYGESPFFEYYADDLQPFFERKWEFLFDFNYEITCKVCELLDVRPTLTLSTGYQSAQGQEADYRDAIRPKHPLPDAQFEAKPYYQVYRQKHGFLPNLSILDLLFNEGNEAILYL